MWRHLNVSSFKKKQLGEKNNLKILNNRKATILTAIFLILAMTTSMAFLPNTDAHTPIWTFDSYAYLVASPNPVGVGRKPLLS